MPRDWTYSKDCDCPPLHLPAAERGSPAPTRLAVARDTGGHAGD